MRQAQARQSTEAGKEARSTSADSKGRGGQDARGALWSALSTATDAVRGSVQRKCAACVESGTACAGCAEEDEEAHRAVQRKSSCSCGGRCPACRARAKAATGAGGRPGPEVGPADDRYERQADAVARRVVRMSRGVAGVDGSSPRRAGPAVGFNDSRLQRRCSTCGAGPGLDEEVLRSESPGGPVQRSCPFCAARATSFDDDGVQRSASPEEPGLRLDRVQRVVDAPGHGKPVSLDVRSRTEPVLGADLSGVRVHTDARAQRAARDIGARAFTHGGHVFLGAGQSTGDLGLMAHELTHTVQADEDRGPAAGPTIRRRVLVRLPAPPPSSRHLDLPEWGEMTEAARQRFLRRESLRGRLSGRGALRRAARVLEDLAAADDDFRFSNDRELEDELVRRVETAAAMEESQRSVEGRRGFGYPFREPNRYWGPRVNYEARAYWTPRVPDDYSRRRDQETRRRIRMAHPALKHRICGDPPPSPDYRWTLTAQGRRDPYTAVVRLFPPQPPHKRTLIHCDYLVSLVHFRAFAEEVGREEFNRRIQAYGTDRLVLQWNAFEEIELRDVREAVPTGPLHAIQRVRPSSPDDLVIGDHVVFHNHVAFSLLNQRVGNPWRLENAILVDRSGGEDVFLGHGSGRRTREGMRRRLSEEYNHVAGDALSLTERAESRDPEERRRALVFLTARFPNVYVRRSGDGWEWVVHGERFSREITMELREIRPDEVVGLRDPEDPTGARMYRVRRPVMSR